MSSIVLVERRLPIFIRFLSQVPAYAHFTISVVAIVVCWLHPSLVPKVPDVRRTLKPCVARSPSLKSHTSTLVENAPGKAKDSTNVGGEHKAHSKLHDSFSKLGRPVKMMMSPTIARVRPYARRVALPARRFTVHFASAVTTPFHHPRRSLDVEPDSYFGFGHPPKADAQVEAQVEAVEVNENEAGGSSAVASGAVETVIHASPKEATKFKRLVKKTKALLRLRRRSCRA